MIKPRLITYPLHGFNGSLRLQRENFLNGLHIYCNVKERSGILRFGLGIWELKGLRGGGWVERGIYLVCRVEERCSFTFGMYVNAEMERKAFER